MATPADSRRAGRFGAALRQFCDFRDKKRCFTNI